MKLTRLCYAIRSALQNGFTMTVPEAEWLTDQHFGFCSYGPRGYSLKHLAVHA